jgi:hypothetical protein
MWFKSNQKILGAFVIGLAMVAGAYIVSNFAIPGVSQPSAVQGSQTPIRTAIAVSDDNQNGIEDWRDAFVTAGPIVISDTNASYTPPTTVTGRLGITFFEEIIRGQNYGPFGRTEEEIITDTVNELSKETNQILYGINDVSILETWNDEEIKNYANTMAGIIVRNNKEGMDNELIILNDIMLRNKTERVAELEVIASVYKSMRDESLLVPVPRQFLKQHLDLINTYEAIHKDVSAMTLGLSDPAVALLRIKRYEEDALGFKLALENMYRAIEPYSGLFSSNDAATYFAVFNPNNLVQQ